MRFGAALGAAALLGGCAAGAGLAPQVPRDPPAYASPDAPGPAGTAADYRIGPADELTVTVFEVPDLSGKAVVDATGRLVLPLIGRMEVAGRTPGEVGEAIARAYGSAYLRHPQVSVAVDKALNQRISVDGAVNQPGVYPVAGGTTLLQAVSLAHGATPNAILSRVVVFRRIGGARQAAAFDLRRIRAGRMADPAVYGGDEVVVDGSGVRADLHDLLSIIPVIALFGAL